MDTHFDHDPHTQRSPATSLARRNTEPYPSSTGLKALALAFYASHMHDSVLQKISHFWRLLLIVDFYCHQAGSSMGAGESSEAQNIMVGKQFVVMTHTEYRSVDIGQRWQEYLSCAGEHFSANLAFLPSLSSDHDGYT